MKGEYVEFKCREDTERFYMRKLKRDFHEAQINKLPNEFRHCFTDFNGYNESGHGYLDENDYNFG